MSTAARLRPISTVSFLGVALALASALAVVGCQTLPSTSAPLAASAFAPAPAVLPIDPVAAQVVLPASAFAANNAANAEIAVCELPSGVTRAHIFKSGRYWVDAPAGGACAAAGHARVWVDKRFVEIADSAYAPLLTRLRERAGLVVDIAYAGDRIFCEGASCLIREPLYGKARCYLSPLVADKLREAAAALQARDASLSLRVLDCYRPVDVQVEMFKRVGNPEWVAAPKAPRFGGHNRGIAIDLTLEKDGVALDMGSAFDLFTEVSNYDAKGLSPSAQANRKLLRELMIGLGMRPYDSEWWHFSLPIETRAMNFPL